jgi:putative peptidoglycan lipid II flippase
MMISPVLFAVSGMFMGILNARHHFLAPAFAPMFYNAAIIVGALVSDDVKVLAFCVVIGALLHLLVQVPALRLVGMRWEPIWDWRDKAVREVGRLMGPRVIGLAAFQLNFVIATFFASNVREGAISAVNYAWLVMMTPLGLFGMAISTAVFPRMAEQAARSEEELQSTLSRSLRLILFLTVPAGIGLMILAKPTWPMLLAVNYYVFSNAMLNPSVAALLSRRTSSGQGMTMGLNNSFLSLGRIIGPLWAGVVYDLHFNLPYLTGAVIMVVGFGISVWGLARQEAPSVVIMPDPKGLQDP